MNQIKCSDCGDKTDEVLSYDDRCPKCVVKILKEIRALNEERVNMYCCKEYQGLDEFNDMENAIDMNDFNYCPYCGKKI